MIIRCPKCNNLFKPIKYRTASDGSKYVECFTCNYAFKPPATEAGSLETPAASEDDTALDSGSEYPIIEFIEPDSAEIFSETKSEANEKNHKKIGAAQKIKASQAEIVKRAMEDKSTPDFIQQVKHTQPITDRKPRIMIIDDTAFFRRVLSDLFEENEYEVITAVDGLDGINKIKNEQARLDLLLLDLQLPKMSGFEVLDNLRRTGIIKNFPVLIITGIHQKTEEVRLVKQLGATGYISKANPPEYFLFRVNQILKPSEAVWVEPEESQQD
ncbi:MAG: hypothetical protein A2161_22320 [Candidatus Schekmanbacteria bacterium RBG_13_48_7]|uniref:Response regulatory domain-containing protein n=1 Tax=Candidatus Schekmanbacteria bacterium RBG_13_48_7 TaxID=1817878 RepID=A0A1F7RYA6_9BACT|nr:MAG: hypothetical protein A2161_22320 [Candidatus Schekmanbacteria bacterium RBG_13_48_7]